MYLRKIILIFGNNYTYMKTLLMPIRNPFPIIGIGFALLLLFLLVAFQQPISPSGEPMKVNNFYRFADSLLLKRDFWAAEEFVKSVHKDASNAKDEALKTACLLVSGKIAQVSTQIDFMPSVYALEAAEQRLLKEDSAVWQLQQCQLELARSLFLQSEQFYGLHQIIESPNRNRIDSLLTLLINSKDKAQPVLIELLFLRALNYLGGQEIEKAKASLAPLQALQRRFADYKKEYDYLLQTSIALHSNSPEKAAVYLEKVAPLLQNKSASDFGLQQLCRNYLLLSDWYAAKDSMLLAAECTQRVLIAMSVGFDEPENLLPNPEFEQMQHLPLCIDALLRKARYIKKLDKTGFAPYNCTHLAARASGHLQNQVVDFKNVLAYKTQMMHAYSDALQATYALYQNSEDTTFISDAIYLIDREKSLQFWAACHFVGQLDSLQGLEQHYAGQTWWYAKEAAAAKAKGDSAAVVLFEKRKSMANEQRESVVEALMKQDEAYLTLKYAPYIPSLQNLQKNLAKEELLLLYFNGTDSSYILAISPTTIDFRCISSRDSLNRLTHNFDKEVLASEQTDYLNTKGLALSRLLLPKDLSACKRLIIIPDFGLYHIPFEALPLPKSSISENNFKTYPYLFTQHSVSYQYSLRNWWHWKQGNPAPASYRIMAFAPQLTNQKSISAELEYLSTRFSATILKDSAATRESLFSQAKQYGFIHWTSTVPLEMEMVDGIRLNAALVLLNNTQTDVFKNDYAILGQGLAQAGAAAVMSSLWTSQAEESVKLLELFYEHIQQGLSKDEALRQARIDYLAQMPEDQAAFLAPRFWAQYQVYGDYRNVSISEPISYIWWYLLPIFGLLGLGWWAMRGLRQRKRF